MQNSGKKSLNVRDTKFPNIPFVSSLCSTCLAISTGKRGVNSLVSVLWRQQH